MGPKARDWPILITARPMPFKAGPKPSGAKYLPWRVKNSQTISLVGPEHLYLYKFLSSFLFIPPS